MFHRLCRPAVAVAVAVPLFCTAAFTQTPEKAAPKVLAATTSSAAAKAALTAALEEVENIGGARRYDAKLKAVIDADAQFALGRAYYAQWTSGLTVAERMAQLDQAVKDAATATTPELVVVAALREQRAGRNAEARDLLDIAIKMVPDDPHVIFLRQLYAANRDDALRIGQTATQKFPDFAPSYNTLAYQLNAAGQKAEAVAAIQKYVSLMPKHPNPHDSYAEILSLQGNYDESDTHYRHALEIDPGYEVAHEGLAENAMRRGNAAGARPHLEQSLAAATTPQRKIALNRSIAVTYVFENNLKKAKEHIATAMRIGEEAKLPVSVQNDHRILGVIAATQGKAAEAIKHYTAGAPTNSDPYIPLGDAILHGVLGHPNDVATAKAKMATNAATLTGDPPQDAVHLTEVIYAVANKDVAAARPHQAAIKGPMFKAMAGAFMARPLARAGDAAAAKAATADVDAYRELNLNVAIARLIARAK